MSTSPVNRADVCAVAVAECFRGDGEILANPIGTIPMVGGRLARATFEPELMMTDGEAALVANDAAFDYSDGKIYETWNPYRHMFDIVWSGQRHVMMSPTQIDRYANMNFSAIGPDPTRPKIQLLGFRGGPSNTISHTTSYWVPKHSAKTFVESVDVVCGVGYDRAAQLSAASRRDHEIRRVITNLCVIDFATDDNRMRLASVHPGVSVGEVVEATGFDLVVDDQVAVTRLPSDEELRLLNEVIDPEGRRFTEIPRDAAEAHGA